MNVKHLEFQTIHNAYHIRHGSNFLFSTGNPDFCEAGQCNVVSPQNELVILQSLLTERQVALADSVSELFMGNALAQGQPGSVGGETIKTGLLKICLLDV